MKHETSYVQNGNTLSVTREFNAPVDKVWKAWTTAEILDKWWAPGPYVNETKELEFKEGGRWLYKMTGPQGDTHWCRADYEKIVWQQSITSRDSFCDENGYTEKPFPNSQWNNQFKATDSGSKVEILIIFDGEDALKKIVEMGFKEGLAMGLSNLDEVLIGL